MSDDQPKYIRLGFQQRQVSTILKLRWDRSPRTCETVCLRLPIEEPCYHAAYANNEVYTLLNRWDAFPPDEWTVAYPGQGDLMYVPKPPGPLARRYFDASVVVDIAYFYDRGNNLYGPYGPAIGNIFATETSVEQTEAFAEACMDIWRQGHADPEHFVIEPA